MDSTNILLNSSPSAGPSMCPSNADALSSSDAYVATMRAIFPSTRIRPQEWEKHRRLIEDMHASDHSMKDIKTHMELTHGFFASESQWKKKLSQWNLRRNLGKGVAKFVGKRALRRQNEQQKRTEFRYKGMQQPADKIERHVKELQKVIEDGGVPSPTEATPEDMSYCTIGSPSLSFVAPRSQDQEHIGTPHPPLLDSVGPLKMARYKDKGVDQWMSIAKQAASLVKGGRYTEAKDTLLNSLDGLEVLLGPENAQTTDLLTYFVEAAVEHGDFIEAANRLHKSHRNHSDNLGQTHVRTWQSLIRLGTFYKKRGAQSEAYHMLFNGRQGLLAVFKDDPEQALSYTRVVTHHIIDILIDQNDFLAAEEEIKMAIERTKAAGVLHDEIILHLRHDLAHLYNNDEWLIMARQGKLPYPTRNGVGPLLLEGISSFAKHKDHEHAYQIYLCSLEQLRIFYETTSQHEKIPELLTQIEDYLTTSRLPISEIEFKQSLSSMKGVASSYQNLKKYEQAEWWLLRRQQQINTAPTLGPTSFEAVANQMQLVELYHEQQNFDEERQALRQAQLLARDALPEDHEFHAYVADLLGGARTGRTRCQSCLVNVAQVTVSADLFPSIRRRETGATEFVTLSDES